MRSSMSSCSNSIEGRWSAPLARLALVDSKSRNYLRTIPRPANAVNIFLPDFFGSKIALHVIHVGHLQYARQTCRCLAICLVT